MNLYETIKKNSDDLNRYTDEEIECNVIRTRDLEGIKIRSGGLIGLWNGSTVTLNNEGTYDYVVKDKDGNVLKRLYFDVNDLGRMSDKDYETLKINIENELRAALADKNISVSRECPMCGKEHIMYVDARKYTKYISGNELIQDVFPDLNPLEREFIKTGYCEDCQSRLFNSSYTSDKILSLDEVKKLAN